jgi:radical SAM protein with 4Fe4S-binding SPASM domain
MNLREAFISQARRGPLCILPFNQLVIDANGDCYPCEALRGHAEFNLGNIHKLEFQQIWNGELIKSFRRTMMEQKRTPSCDFSCHEDYERSCKSLNPISSFPKFIQNIDKIDKDGTVGFLPSTFFLKTTNICNLACQYCKEESSTTWSSTNNLLFNKKYSTVKKDSNENLADIIIKNSADLECIYFSGGEPSLVPSYSLVLEKILNAKGANLKVAAASNLSLLNDTSKKFFNLISKFNSSMIFCSIDSHNETNDFIRMFSTFDKTKQTFEYIKVNHPNIQLYINSVISIFNVMSIFDFHKEWYDKGLVEVDSFRYVLCQFPKIFNILYLSDELKKKIIDKFNMYINWLKEKEIKNNDYPNNNIRNYIYLKNNVNKMLSNTFATVDDFINVRREQKTYMKKISSSKFKLPKDLSFIEEEFNKPVIRYNKKLIYVNS